MKSTSINQGPTVSHETSEASVASNDREPIYSRFADDEIYIPLLVEFADDLPGHVAEIGQVIARRDDAEIARLSHRLKGAAATYGYPDLSILASEAEKLASNTPSTSSTPRLDVLAAAMTAVSERICLAVRNQRGNAPQQ